MEYYWHIGNYWNIIGMFKKWATYLKFVYQISSAKLNCLGIPLVSSNGWDNHGQPQRPCARPLHVILEFLPLSMLGKTSDIHATTIWLHPWAAMAGRHHHGARTDGGRSSHCWATRLGCLSQAQGGLWTNDMQTMKICMLPHCRHIWTHDFLEETKSHSRHSRHRVYITCLFSIAFRAMSLPVRWKPTGPTFFTRPRSASRSQARLWASA